MKAAIIAALVAALVSAAAATATTSGLITGKQIKNCSIGTVDLSAKAKQALRGQRGPRGFAGIPGATGPAGAPGANGGFDPANVHVVKGATFTIAPDTLGQGQVSCPSGEVALNGSWTTVAGGVAEVFVNLVGGTTYFISVWNHGQFTSAEVTPYVVCAGK
jgi:hypothetical protein